MELNNLRPSSQFVCRPDLLLSSSLALFRCSDEEEFETVFDRLEVDLAFIADVFKVRIHCGIILMQIYLDLFICLENLFAGTGLVKMIFHLLSSVCCSIKR